MCNVELRVCCIQGFSDFRAGSLLARLSKEPEMSLLLRGETFRTPRATLLLQVTGFCKLPNPLVYCASGKTSYTFECWRRASSRVPERLNQRPPLGEGGLCDIDVRGVIFW